MESVDAEFADLPNLIDAEGDQPSIWDRVFFSCTDGASAMRSTPMYAGLDSYPEGISSVSHMKRDNKPQHGNLHCICHNWNLGLKEALKANIWTDVWIRHTCGVQLVFKISCTEDEVRQS